MNKKYGSKAFKTKILICATLGLIFPFFVMATTVNGDIDIDWDSDAYKKNSSYTFSTSTILNANLLTKIVGCTGIVNKIAKQIDGFLGSSSTSTSASTKKIVGTVTGDQTSTLLTVLGTGTGISTSGSVPVSSDTMEEKQDELQETEDANKLREECFNGIAYTLAKKQLSDMTKYTMSWISTGFNGNPMYLVNAKKYLESVTDDLIEDNLYDFLNFDEDITKEICVEYEKTEEEAYEDWTENYSDTWTWDDFVITYYPSGFATESETDCAEYQTQKIGTSYPYSQSFATSYIMTYKNWNYNYEDSMKSSLSYYLTGTSTMDDFEDDFSLGGWNGWLALTQRPQNNLIGYSLLESEKIQETIDEEKTETENELSWGQGYFSQKNCAVTEESKAKTLYALQKSQGKTTLTQSEWIAENYPDGYDCEKWETVTPGSAIKNKVDTYLNTPERQLEIADSINDVLSVVFSNIISKFQYQGLTSLAYDSDYFSELYFGSGDNTSISLREYLSSGYTSTSFDIIKDLGNTYYDTDEIIYAGDWNANINRTIDSDGNIEDTGLYEGKGTEYYYYVVTTAGNTSLFDGNISWSVGDRAFFNGTDWIKWPAQSSAPIETRGVIQIQQDYISAAKQALTTLPAIMPALGELDYCIPGPNPNWASNSTDTREAYFDYIDGFTYEDIASNGWKVISKIANSSLFGNNIMSSIVTWLTGISFDEEKYAITPPGEDTVLYDNFKDTFTNMNSGTLWEDMKSEDSNILFFVEGKPTTLDLLSSSDDYVKRIDEKIQSIKLFVQNIYDEYDEKIVEKYGYSSSMQTEYNTYENKDVYNTEYLPMANDGLNLTEDIVAYNDAVNEAYESYTEDIKDVQSAIYTLEKIRVQVNNIVAAAQERRQAELDAAGIVVPDYCYSEEDITYIDESESSYNSEEERCNDDIDNDGDGMIDYDDADCYNVTVTTTKEILCYDEIDNDGDGYTDEDDTDCFTKYRNSDSDDEESYE